MAFRKNTNMVNAQAAASSGLYDGGTLEIRSGTQPASANDAASGTLLCSITLPGTAFGAPSNGVVAKSGTWAGTAVGDGTAGWARFISAANDRRMDCSVSQSGGGGDMIIDNASILTNGTVTVTSFEYAVPLTA